VILRGSALLIEIILARLVYYHPIPFAGNKNLDDDEMRRQLR
jgi:hypothetical protein